MAGEGATQAARRPGIIVLGAPRSGTTLLRRLLDAHPNIACPPETYLFRAAARFLDEERFAEGLRIGVLLGLGFAGVDEATTLARLRRFVFGFLEEHAARQGKPRWAEKTAFNAFYVPAIRRLCAPPPAGGDPADDVRFVCIQRHGLDVAVSLEELVKKTGGYVDELHRYIKETPAPYEAFARAWRDCAGAIADLVDADPRAIGVRYEELVVDPEATLRRILDHVGEPWDGGLLARVFGDAPAAGSVGFGDWKTYARPAIDGSSVERWRALSRATRRRLAELCNPTLERLGYDAVATAEPAPEADADARRRYELGLMLGRMRAQKAAEAEAAQPAADADADSDSDAGGSA
ncbi:MAG: sulfotransferase [Nannocystaceae bacterium]